MVEYRNDARMKGACGPVGGKQGPLVSIITPILNRARTIGYCLTSVANQTYRPIEHIVIDGGSTDGTIEFVRALAEDHPICWISEPDKGKYHAVNKALKLSRGEVLGYLNMTMPTCHYV
jgi:glycosyltransferase involved in cell wall biosynthesis